MAADNCDQEIGKTLVLAAMAAAVFTGPLAFGIVNDAQTAPKKQAFEVAVFRLEDPHSRVDYNRPDAPNQTREFPTNRLTMFHTTLKSLICDAYGFTYNNVLGGPAWLASQHYDLSAKVDGNARLTKKQMAPMLRTLLEERVHLVVHTEDRIVPGYALVIAKGGSKLKPNTGAPFLGADSGFELKFQNQSAGQIAQTLGNAIKAPVVDKTGLTGTYDYDLKFNRDPEEHPNDAPHPNYGSIFSAVQEQLGLKLAPQKIPSQYLIVDRVDKVPTEK